MESYVTLDTGVRLEYVETGPSDGSPVILLHGVTDSWRSFEGLVPLLPSTLRTFSLSQRGHGGSSRPASGYRIQELAADVHAFMAALQLPAATVVGHSMGSVVAQRLAIDHPERVAALVLMGAFASFQSPELRSFVTTSVRPLRDPIGAAFAREWQLSTLARPMDPAHLDRIVVETLKVPAFVWHATFEGFLATPDWTNELASVRVPTLLLRGERDSYAEAEDQKQLLEAIAGSTLITYAGAGHAFHWEDPGRTARDMATFMGRAAPRPDHPAAMPATLQAE